VKTSTRGLSELARLYGVERSYEGMDGRPRRAERSALSAVLRALGAQLEDDGNAHSALRARRAELDALGMQPVVVAWDGALPAVRVRLAGREADRAAIEIRLESGDIMTRSCAPEPIAARARAGWTPTHALRLGARLPIGYHQLQVETAGATLHTLIIAAPRHAYLPAKVRDWGVFVPLHALCSASSWGAGDYGDLARTARWVDAQGGSFLATLPLLPTFLDVPFEPSPYSPASRLFWSDFFVDVTLVPGWSPRADLDDEIAACRRGQLVDYRRIAALKRREMERALGESRDAPHVIEGMRQFAAAHPRVEDYARFRAVGDRLRADWHAWPDRLHDGEIRDGDYAPEDFSYHLFAQWQADRQLGVISAARGAGAAGLYLDMPLGVNAGGYDVWRFRDLFAEGVSAGAPPDPLFTGGQNWGFRPPHPGALRASGYGYFVDTLRHHFRHAPMLRLDHVMSLYRLFWIPDGVAARDGVYVRYAEDELFAVLTLESARHQAVVVGEDLGTVPAAVRRAMDTHHIVRMHVVQYEASADREPPLQQPAETVVASLNTHDMPLFAGFWHGSEIDDQLDLGLIDDAEHARALAQRSHLRLSLSRSAGAGGEIEAALVGKRLLERLAASPARHVLVTLEDLWLEDRPQNVPGTANERPNWQRRATRTLEEITEDAAIRRLLNAISERRAMTLSTRTDG
jgi:4-alpha-glucanotransferase